jgi:hypothetical protein
MQVVVGEAVEAVEVSQVPQAEQVAAALEAPAQQVIQHLG